MDALVVLLAAPLASFGESPGNAYRGTADRPTRSALLGLAGAALGVERDDDAGQRALGASFDVATRTLKRGLPLGDFHTFQSLPSAKGRVETRAEALAMRDDLNTSITRRDYRADGLWQAAYVAREGAGVSLAALRDAFLKPRFVLWLGRKSCPLAHPLAPLIVQADDLVAAFAEQARHTEKTWPGLSAMGGDIASDERIFTMTNLPSRRHRRMDEPLDRQRWHFASRFERVATPPASSPSKPHD